MLKSKCKISKLITANYLSVKMRLVVNRIKKSEKSIDVESKINENSDNDNNQVKDETKSSIN